MSQENRTDPTERGRVGQTAGQLDRAGATMFGSGAERRFTSPFLPPPAPPPPRKHTSKWITREAQPIPPSAPVLLGAHPAPSTAPRSNNDGGHPQSARMRRKVEPIIYLPPSKKLQILSSRLRTRWKVSRTICC